MLTGVVETQPTALAGCAIPAELTRGQGVRQILVTAGCTITRAAVVGMLLAMLLWSARLTLIAAFITFVPCFAWAAPGGCGGEALNPA